MTNTKRRHSETAPREIEGVSDQDNSVLQNVPDMVTILDPDRTIRYVSPAAQWILGYPSEELLGTGAFDYVHPEDIQFVASSFAEAMQKPGMRPPLEFRLRRADGSWRHVEVIHNNRLDDPAVRAMVTTTRDITERKRAEEKLRQGEERLRAQYNGFPIPTFSWRKVQDDFELVNYNEAANKITRGGLTGLLGTRASEWYADKPQILDMLSRCFSEGITIQREMPWRMVTTGEHKHFAVTFAYVPPDLVIHHAEDITERKRAEEQTRFQAQLLDAVGQAVIATDPQGKITYWNRCAEERYGWSEEEVMGRSIMEVILPEGQLERAEEVRAGLTAGRSWSGEFEQRRKDGTSFPAMVTTTPVHDEEGSLVGLIGVSTDITELKETEELRRSEERFRALVQNASDVILVMGADQTVRYVSPAVERMLGYKPEEVIGKNNFSVAHPEDMARVEELVGEAARNSGTTSSAQLRLRHKDGSWRNVETNCTSLLENPAVEGVVFNLRDITERKEAEERLRESEERFRSTFEEASIGMDVTSLDGRFLQVNPSLCEMLGYSEEELLATTFLAITHPDDIEADLDYTRRMLDSEINGFQMEKRYVHAEGHVVWVSLNASVVRDQEGHPLYFIGQIQDITERKRADEALRRSEASLTEAQRIAHLGSWKWDIKTGEVFWSDEAYCIYGFEPNEFSPTLETVEEVFHPDDRHLFRATIDDAYHEAESYDFEHRIVRPDGEVRWVHRRGEVVRGEGGELLRMVGTVHDITEHKRAEERLKHSLNALLAVHEAGRLLSSTLEPEEIGSRLLSIMRRISGLTAAVISLWDETDEHFKVWQSIGLEELAPKVRYRPGIREAREACLQSDTPRLFWMNDQEEEEGEAREDEPAVGLLLPLRVRERNVGVLEAYGPTELGEDLSVALLESLAGQATGAFENARLYGELAERERRLQELVGKLLEAQEEERRRVSYEVHDGLAQVATSAHHHLQAYARRYPPKDLRSRENKDLGRSLRLVKQTVSEARRVIANLRPRELDDSGLAAAVSQEVKWLRDEEGWRVDYEQKLGDERLPTELETALFRAAQEALTNARKHAKSDRLRVELSRDERSVRLRVRDWGQGFEPDNLNTEGPGERVGISGMRERIALLGGRFDLWSQPGEGTLISVEVPLSATRENGDG